MTYQLVKLECDAGRLAGELAGRGPNEVVAIDSETTTLFDKDRTFVYLGDRCTCVSLSFRDQAYVVAPEVATPVVAAVAAGRSAMHNSPFDRAVFATSFGVDFEDRLVYDTMTVDWLLDESADHRLKQGLGARLFGYDAVTEKRDLDALKRGRTVADLYRERREFVGRLETAAESREWARREASASKRTWSDLTVNDEVFAAYAAKDAELTAAVYHHQQRTLRGGAADGLDVLPGLRRELDVTAFCYRLSRTGLRANRERAGALSKWAGIQVDAIAAEFDGVDLASPAQLCRLLYDTWGLPCTRTTKKGNRSTDHIALQRLAWHEGVTSILRHRELTKLLSAFYDPILRFVGTDGRVHPAFHCARTDTGRFSCSTPNVQQLPTDDAAGVRAIFEPEPGFELVEWDLGQIELRVAAALAGEQLLLDQFDRGEDPYLDMAATLGVERKPAKRICLAAQYGMRERKLALMLAEGSGAEPNVPAARAILDAYWAKYPALARCMAKAAADWQRNRHLKLWVPGRYRRLWNSIEKHPEPTHKAFNALIQGGCAELLKSILLAFEPMVAEHGRIVATIHDSIVVEVEPGAARHLDPLLDKVTAAINPFPVPLIWERKPWAGAVPAAA